MILTMSEAIAEGHQAPHDDVLGETGIKLVSLRNPEGMKERPGDGSGGDASYVVVLHGVPKHSQLSLQKLGIIRGTLVPKPSCAAPACFQGPDLSPTAAESRLAASHARPYHSLCLPNFLLCTLL